MEPRRQAIRGTSCCYISFFIAQRQCVDQNDKPEVQLFDEMILQKLNRSKLSHKQPTPFLDSRASEVKNTFVCPPPDTTGLQAGGGRVEWLSTVSID